MKYALLLALTTTLSLTATVQGGESNEAHDHNAPHVTEVVDGANVYGDHWPGGKAVGIAEALSSMQTGETQAGVFSGKITQVCQSSGCWMMLTDGAQAARVDFNDHAFFIPKDSSGQAEVYGKLTMQEMSAEMRAHLKEDGAGDVAPKTYEIVATSVKISG